MSANNQGARGANKTRGVHFQGDEKLCKMLLQREAREQMKLRLLADIKMDLMICEIEGWDKREYLTELKEMINSIGEPKT